MPKYAALLIRNEAEAPAKGSPEEKQWYQAWAAFNAEIGKAGVLESGVGLASPSTATTVRVRDGKTMTTDGPFAETREQLGGVFMLNCKDLDEAIEWAAKIPDASSCCVEVRPLWGGQ